jgi:hypothetical protein
MIGPAPTPGGPRPGALRNPAPAPPSWVGLWLSHARVLSAGLVNGCVLEPDLCAPPRAGPPSRTRAPLGPMHFHSIASAQPRRPEGAGKVGRVAEEMTNLSR